MTRIFIEDYELDIDKNLVNRITYAIDDLEHLDTKTTTFTKTIVLPGTANNNTLLGNIFEFNNANFTYDSAPNVKYNFNAAKSAKCRIDVNGMQVVKGVFRLLEIVYDGGQIEYECSIFGELGGFINKIGNLRLEDLDFSDYDQDWTTANIINSWDNAGNTFQLTVFSFTAASKKITFFSDVMSLFPAVGEQFTIYGSASNDGTYTVAVKNVLELTVVESLVDEGGTIPYPTPLFAPVNTSGTGVYYPLVDIGQVSTGPPYGVAKKDYQYRAFRPALHVFEYLDKIITNAGYTWESDFCNSAFFKRLIIPHNSKALTRISTTALDISYSGAGQVLVNPTHYLNLLLPTHTTLGSFTTSDDHTFTYGGAAVSGVFTLHIVGTINSNNLENNVFITLVVGGVGGSGGGAATQVYPVVNPSVPLPFDLTLTLPLTILPTWELEVIVGSGSADPPQEYDVIVTSARVTFITNDPNPVQLNLNEAIIMNDTIPRGIYQKDFFASLLKMFYLMVTEDKFKERHLIITPWIDFYDTDPATVIDWSDKVERMKQIRVKPMSEVNARFYELKFKKDTDFYIDGYQKKYNEGYGDRFYDNNLEFSKDTETVELIFANAVLVGYAGEDKIVPTIFKKTNDVEERIDHVVRIMQAKKVTGVASWDIMDGATVIAGSLTYYPYAGHLDDPDAPDVDICFGVPKELFFALVSGNLSNNLFNAFYSSYMAEITDKDSRLLQAMVKLNDIDIYNLDFSKFIYIDGGKYRLQRLIDYAAGEDEPTKAELLRVIYTTY